MLSFVMNELKNTAALDLVYTTFKRKQTLDDSKLTTGCQYISSNKQAKLSWLNYFLLTQAVSQYMKLATIRYRLIL